MEYRGFLSVKSTHKAMKIRITDIPPQGLKVNDTLPLESLNSRMQEGQDKDIVFLSSPLVEITVFKTPGGADVKGLLRSRYRQSCSRCLDPLERDLEVAVSLVLQHATERDKRGIPAGEEAALEDIGVVYFEGDNVELEEVLQENLILALERFWHPPIRDDGSCSLCGLRFKDTLEKGGDAKSTLGQLIKAAAKKK